MKNPFSKFFRRNEESSESVILTSEQLIALWERIQEEFDGKAPKAMELSPVAAAHRILTNSMGALPVDLYRKANGRRETVENHRALYPLTVRTNVNMSPFLFKKVMESKCYWYGEAFAYIDRSKEHIELLPMPDNPQLYETESGERWYVFTGDVKGVNLTRKFHEDELIHLFNETGDGRSGVGMLSMARQTISTDLSAQKYAGKFYKQGARPSGVIEVPTKLDNENKDKVRNAFERAVGGMDNAFRVAVMDLGMKYTQLGISQKDAQFVESRQFTVEEVSRFSGVPMYKLQAGKQSYESNEQNGIEYVTDTLRPKVVHWEEEFRYKLLLPQERENMYFKMNLAAEMRGDDKSRGAYYQVMIDHGIMRVNECRRLEELDDDPNGDVLLVTKNLTTLERLVEGGEDSENI